MMFNGDELQDSRDPRLSIDCRETHIVQFGNFITHGLEGGKTENKVLSIYVFIYEKSPNITCFLLQS